ncbi:ribosome biogenesis protein BRX1 homolog [Eurytemora carolleeae]|uniref:ribosome biogenesis protein BRX1 homolog n=1 Tax=Eurytemora carolleeae TaxID=1294199 RepID=UPI000C773E6E|nr:ribosome biogenesis protein BRX1 homolog [Eurytemora carolleeae]|eukprot:XP_023328139.1 ribosome biogenesis protein BRX1 homolog [Eurytemora affinis]
MGEKKLKRPREEMKVVVAEEEVPATRGSEDEPVNKKIKWTNKSRVLVLSARGIGHRGRHLLQDIQSMMPHSKSDSKMQKKETLFAVNEIAEMKNCEKCLLFEGRKGKDVYLWAANVARGPSVKFEVENIHTMAELKMTGNCLRASRPLLSFDQNFTKDAHWQVMKELFTQIFGVPNHHPKSQPFFDHVFTFCIVDDKIWFRNFQILEESGSLAEIGPRMVLNPIKVFDGSFSGQTIWENGRYITPNSKRALLKKAKSRKYQDRVEAKAAYEAGRPTGPTFKVDETDEVFQTIEEPESDSGHQKPRPGKKRKQKKKTKKGSEKIAVTAGEEPDE